MKKILLFLLMVISINSFSQLTDSAAIRSSIITNIVTNTSKSITAVQVNDIMQGYLNIWNKYSIDTSKISNDSIFHRKNNSWVFQFKVLVPGDTVSVSNRINLKLNKTDTSTLSNRIDLKLNKTDTSTLSNRIDLKLNKTDTSTLSNRIDQKLNKTDTSTLSNRIDLKLNKTDTSTLSNRINARLPRDSTYGTTGAFKLSGGDSISVVNGWVTTIIPFVPEPQPVALVKFNGRQSKRKMREELAMLSKEIQKLKLQVSSVAKQ